MWKVLCLVVALALALALALRGGEAAERIRLDSGDVAWTVCAASFPRCVPGNVPGHAVVDLTESHAAPDDLYRDLRELDVARLGWDDVVYTAHDVPVRPRSGVGLLLVFERLDTVAQVSVNGQVLADAARGDSTVANAFVQHAFPIPSCIVAFSQRASLNITVAFTSSLQYAKDQAAAFAKETAGHPYPHTQNFNSWTEPSHRNMIRKPASDFGWDWGPAFPASSIPGHVYLIAGLPGSAVLDSRVRVDTFSFAPVSPCVRVVVTVFLVRIPASEADVVPNPQSLRVVFNHNETASAIVFPRHYQANATATSTKMDEGDSKSFEFAVCNPILWWPRGSRGLQASGKEKPYLYDLEVTLEGDSMVLRKRVGLRTVSLVSHNHAFYIQVNGERVDWRGTNLVPFDAFHPTHRSRANMKRAITDALDMNQNAFRVWGGGVFPLQSFYDACDEAGIMVWQDLPWACAVFPASPPDVLRRAQHETTQVVMDLQSHASVLVWGGNNEVEASFTWFPETLARPALYRRDYVRLFMDTVGPAATSAGAAVFVDSSPSNGVRRDGSKIWGDVTDARRGDVHFYNYDMDCEDAAVYPRALFVSEHGVQSMPSVLEFYVRDDGSDDAPFPRVLELRQRHEHGFTQMQRQAERMFAQHRATLPLFQARSKREYRAAAVLSQIVQGRCLARAVASWRTRVGDNHGTLLWQQNDVWPGISWSLVEYDGSWKVSAYIVRDAFRPVQVLIERRLPPHSTIPTSLAFRLAAYEEQLGREFVGELVITPFSWSQSHVCCTTKMLVRVTLPPSKLLLPVDIAVMEHVGTDTGVRITARLQCVHTGQAFVVDGDFEPPMGRFHALSRPRQRPVVRAHDANCTVVVQHPFSAQPLAYVWLTAPRMQSLGRFSNNGFLLLPGETLKLDFVCGGEAPAACVCSFGGLSLVSLNDLVTFGEASMAVA